MLLFYYYYIVLILLLFYYYYDYYIVLILLLLHCYCIIIILFLYYYYIVLVLLYCSYIIIMLFIIIIITMSYNRTRSRIVIGLLTGHNTLRKHLYVMGLSNKSICRKCGAEEETSVNISCECDALASLRHTHLCSFFLDPEDIRKLSIGTI